MYIKAVTRKDSGHRTCFRMPSLSEDILKSVQPLKLSLLAHTESPGSPAVGFVPTPRDQQWCHWWERWHALRVTSFSPSPKPWATLRPTVMAGCQLWNKTSSFSLEIRGWHLDTCYSCSKHFDSLVTCACRHAHTCSAYSHTCTHRLFSLRRWHILAYSQGLFSFRPFDLALWLHFWTTASPCKCMEGIGSQPAFEKRESDSWA